MANKGPRDLVKSLGDLSPGKIIKEIAKQAVSPSQAERQAKGSK